MAEPGAGARPAALPARLRQSGLALWRRVEHGLDACCGSALNPLRQLGAIGFLCFWLLALSGIVLYAVLDTSADGAYRSIDLLSRQPWYLGGWLRSLHRYAADAFVISMLAHLLREWLHGRYRGFRRFTWLTGVPLPLLVFVCAIGGFWLNWDRLGQFSAIASAEWLDALPLFGSPLTRNFISVTSVSDRLFSLFVFIHLGVPLLLVFGLWFHIQRISRAAVFPPVRVAAPVTLALLLALALPVPSQGPADLASVPAAPMLDWWLLFVHPLMYATSAATVWLLLGAAVLALFALPWLGRSVPAPVARVDPANCNGCRRCFDDCPYAAITMVPHPNGKFARQLAQVDSDLCAGCGICVGSCPSATPFRSAAELVTGIDMPQLRLDSLRQALQSRLAAVAGTQPILVLGCDNGARVTALDAADVTSLSLISTGMLPPSFIEYALRSGASGVLVTGCREAGCEFRFGQRWTRERLQGQREPQLRASVPRQRIELAWADAGDEQGLAVALLRLRRRLGIGVPPVFARETQGG